MRSLVRCALLLAWLFVVTASVHADIPPLDACGTAGQACKNAGNDGTSTGVCTATTCTRATPNGPTSYSCNRCIAGEAPKTPAAKACNAAGVENVSLWAALLTTTWLVNRSRRTRRTQKSSASL